MKDLVNILTSKQNNKQVFDMYRYGKSQAGLRVAEKCIKDMIIDALNPNDRKYSIEIRDNRTGKLIATIGTDDDIIELDTYYV